MPIFSGMRIQGDYMYDHAIQAVAAFCKARLDLTDTKLPDEYGYPSLPLCVIDSVFSIGVRYTSTRNVVARFCRHFGVSDTSPVRPPAKADQLSITKFIGFYNDYGVEGMAERVYQNFQRTSTRNGILKSEAVLRFSQALRHFGVDYMQDVQKVIDSSRFESTIMQVPGQRSGICLRYFYMLAGSDDYVKPDRMLTRFIESAIGKSPSVEESHKLIVGACNMLKKEYPYLTPRALDHLIWEYQREQ